MFPGARGTSRSVCSRREEGLISKRRSRSVGPGAPLAGTDRGVVRRRLVFLALPSDLTVGPRWLFPAIIGVLIVPTVVSHRTGRHHIDRILGFAITSLVTLAMVMSVILLILALPLHKESPAALLLSATSLWSTNILVFALWYWRLDAGGPHGRDARSGHSEGAFLFPQMTMPTQAKVAAGPRRWSPNFLDYLFLAFNTSTGVFTDRYAAAGTMGQGADDGPIVDLIDGPRPTGRAGSQYPVS